MRVLCLDGGGIRGIYSISILKSIEKEMGKPIREIFDCIAGTSTGAIIAASIVLNFNTEQLLNDYLKFGKKIFTRQAKVGIFKTVYSDKYLRRFLQQAFQNITLGEIDKPLLIPAVDMTNSQPFVYRASFPHSNTIEEEQFKLWDAVLSSCSAPVYFPPNRIGKNYLSVDGGLWANNPSLVALTDCIHYFNKKIDDISILSIGTGKQIFQFTNEEETEWGARVWLPVQLPSMKVNPKLFDFALHVSSESVSYHCERLLGERYVRLNHPLPHEIPFDETDYMEELVYLGEQCFINEKEKILQFLNS